jgi:hypothetical protein
LKSVSNQLPSKTGKFNGRIEILGQKRRFQLIWIVYLKDSIRDPGDDFSSVVAVVVGVIIVVVVVVSAFVVVTLAVLFPIIIVSQ